MKTKAVLKIFSLGLLITGLNLPVFAQGTASDAIIKTCAGERKEKLEVRGQSY